MAELHGITFDEATGLEFQQWYGKAKTSWLLGKVIGKITEQWTLRLMALGSSEAVVRQAQGALEALGELDKFCEELARMNVLTEIDETDDDDGPEYGPAGLEESYV